MTTAIYTVQYRRPDDTEWNLWSRYSHCTIGLPIEVCERIARVNGYKTRVIVEYAS